MNSEDNVGEIDDTMSVEVVSDLELKAYQECFKSVKRDIDASEGLIAVLHSASRDRERITALIDYAEHCDKTMRGMSELMLQMNNILGGQ